MKKSARGFEQVGHFFLSGRYPEGAEASMASPITTPCRPADTIVSPESGKIPARDMETVGAVRADRHSADTLPLPCNAEHHINRFAQARDCIGSTAARLEILKRSCQGVILAAEGFDARAVWFRGATAIIQEAMVALTEMINPVCSPESFMDESYEEEKGT